MASLFDWDRNEKAGVFQEESMIDPLNHFRLKEIRKEMVEGKVPRECKICHQMEISGQKSFRMDKLNDSVKSVKDYSEGISDDGTLIDSTVLFLDISVGNVCNLTCMMCHPYYSMGLKGFWDKVGLNLDEKSYTNIVINNKRKCSLPTSLIAVKRITFQGGEPLLSQRHTQILEHFIIQKKAKDIILDYNTNLTMIKKETFDQWKHFNSINLFVSLDGVGEVQERIRFPLKWKSFYNNILQVKKLGYRLNFLTVVQSENLEYLENIINFP